MYIHVRLLHLPHDSSFFESDSCAKKYQYWAFFMKLFFAECTALTLGSSNGWHWQGDMR